MSSVCDNLDDYLAGALTGDAAAHFSSHLRTCEACSEAADEQRWIDRLLTSSDRLELEPTPRALVETVSKPASRPWFMPGRYAGAIIAAAAAILVATGLVLLNREAINDTHATAEVEAAVDDGQTAKNEEQKETGATFVADSNAIAVPVKSHRPSVTIVRVYPTFQPQVDSRTAAIEPAYATNLNDFWTDDSNGG
jgi:anti-sigma factor RsiW